MSARLHLVPDAAASGRACDVCHGSRIVKDQQGIDCICVRCYMPRPSAATSPRPALSLVRDNDRKERR